MERGSKVRLVLISACAVLLVCLLTASAAAILIFRDLRAQQDRLRALWAVRQSSLYAVSLSVHVFHEAVLSRASRPVDTGDGELDHLATDAVTAIRRFPAGPDGEEGRALESMERMVVVERDLCRRGAPAFVELVPAQGQLLASIGRLEASNRQMLEMAGAAAFSTFQTLQKRLGAWLAFALGSGFLLILGSTVYIARLEQVEQTQDQELTASRDELQRLSQRLVNAQESERRSISRELHDEVGQSLSALLVELGRMATSISEDRRAEVERMKEVTQRTVNSVRNLALRLRPSMLDDLGLAAALEWQAREISRRSSMEVDVRTDDSLDHLPEDYSTCIYRVVQEALNNAAAHALAREARVTVGSAQGIIGVTVTDDGQGFDAARTRGMGILGMQERIRNLGGSFSIESTPGRGTTVRATLPLPAERKASG
jgi:signal transduction histidine kinase